MAERRYVERRAFGPTLEWESLPIVGEDRERRAHRRRAWRAGLAGLALFWTAIAAIGMGALS